MVLEKSIGEPLLPNMIFKLINIRLNPDKHCNSLMVFYHCNILEGGAYTGTTAIF